MRDRIVLCMMSVYLFSATTCLADIMVYTNENSFTNAIGTSYYLEEFSSYTSHGQIGSPQSFGPVYGFSYTISAPQGLWSGGGFLVSWFFEDALKVTFTGAPVMAVGGFFFPVDEADNPLKGTIRISLSDGTIHDVEQYPSRSFRGFISDGEPIASLTITTLTSISFSTVDHLYVGSYVGDEVKVALVTTSTKGGRVVFPGMGTFIYDFGDKIILEAKAEAGYVWSGWSGSTNDLRMMIYPFVMDRDYVIRANFTSLLGILYVDDDAPLDLKPLDNQISDPNEDGSAEHPFDSIQEAIDVAGKGAKVVVRPGTYIEPIDFHGKSITVTGLDGINLNTPSSFPVIDANNQGPVVTFGNREGPNTQLSGFVLTGGSAGLAGGIGCQGTSPTISNCLIIGNKCLNQKGGAIYLMDSNPKIVNCTISGNLCGGDGAGINLQGTSKAVVLNTIVWNNTPMDIVVGDKSTPKISYTDSNSAEPGVGNIAIDPNFVLQGFWTTQDRIQVWVPGDYHLKSKKGRWDVTRGQWVVDEITSACIDAGNPSSPIGGEPAPNGGRINLGAYGGTGQASKSPQ